MSVQFCNVLNYYIAVNCFDLYHCAPNFGSCGRYIEVGKVKWRPVQEELTLPGQKFPLVLGLALFYHNCVGRVDENNPCLYLPTPQS